MKPLPAALGAAAIIVFAGAIVCAAQPGTDRQQLRPPETFAQIADQKERSLALFDEAAKVITHPRCLNCHPAGDRPTQGMDKHPHLPLVVRGADGHGAIGMRCTNCHGPANYDPAHVPGHELWHLAPIEMAWQGKTLGEICEQIKDPKRNGGKTLEDLVHHMGRGFARRLGMEPGCWSRACAGHAERTWRSGRGLGEQWRRLPRPMIFRERHD